VPTAPPSGQLKLSLDVQLNTGRAADLAAYAAGVGDRNSPYYHRYLTPGQVDADFGAPSGEVTAVDGALRSAGLTPGATSADGMFVQVSGTVAQVERAFGVKIRGYRVGGRSFFANSAAPSLASAVAGDVGGIIGLDSVDEEMPEYVRGGGSVPVPAGQTGQAGRADEALPEYANNSCPSIAAAFGPGGKSNGTDYYTYDALSSIYGLDKLLANGNDGAGVTVAVPEFENYDPNGVAQIDSCYGHSTSVSEVKVDGGPTRPANSAKNIGVESALDIEIIANMAPGVKIVDYAGPDSATAAQTIDVYKAIVNADSAQVISTSWGLCEPAAQGGGSALQTSENALFEQAAVQGQTVLAASGDRGSTDCYGQLGADNELAVDDPASQPYVTAVGGTGMHGLTNPTPYVWNSSQQSGGKTSYGAGGGGLSNTWPRPSWQSGVTGSGYAANCTKTVSQGGIGCREVPDVSALADSNSGYVIQTYYDDGTHSGEYYDIIGGTSGATPVWAAVIALVDATTQCRLNGEAGFINPSLYAAGAGGSSSSTYTDVTSGNNGISAYHPPYSYAATTGYDLATGWGTPLASGVAANVCQTPITSSASYYQADGPVRLLDTRAKTQVGTVTGPIAVDGTVKVQITGAHNVPSGATAAVLNVTATGSAGSGNATVYPDGGSMPLASNLNWVKGQTTPNLVVVPLKSDGAADITNLSTGTVQFIADLEGYFTTASSVGGVTSSGYTPISPIRALDTRSGGNGVAKGKLVEQKSLSLQVGGATITSGSSSQAIPPGITGVAMNVTVTNATGGGYLAVYPNQTAAGGTVGTPNVSNLNFSVGQTVPNMVMVPVGKDGKVDFFNGAVSGSTDVIADIAGYYTAGTNGDAYHPLGPVRVVDTRSGVGTTSVAPIAAKGTLDLALPSSYAAVIANVTVTQPQAGGFLNVYPLGTALPNVSNLNFGAGQTIPNLAIVQSDSGVTFYNNASGTVHLVADVSGYFSAH